MPSVTLLITDVFKKQWPQHVRKNQFTLQNTSNFVGYVFRRD
jgi:hypothetical protein